jgi:hypothetical protein
LDLTVPGSGPRLVDQLGLDFDAVLRVARAERSFGRAYAAEGRALAAGTLLAVAGAHYALVQAQSARACLQEATQIYSEMSHPYALVTAVASGDLAACQALARASWVVALATKMTLDERAYERPRDRNDLFFGEPDRTVDAAHGVSALLLLQTLLQGEGLQSPDFEGIHVAFADAAPPLANAWSGPFTYGTLGRVLSDVAQRVPEPSSARRLLEALAETQAAQREDAYHWRGLSGQPAFPVEVLAISQVLLSDSLWPRWVPAEIRSPLEVASDLRAT